VIERPCGEDCGRKGKRIARVGSSPGDSGDGEGANGEDDRAGGGEGGLGENYIVKGPSRGGGERDGASARKRHSGKEEDAGGRKCPIVDN